MVTYCNIKDNGYYKLTNSRGMDEHNTIFSYYDTNITFFFDTAVSIIVVSGWKVKNANEN